MQQLSKRELSHDSRRRRAEKHGPESLRTGCYGGALRRLHRGRFFLILTGGKADLLQNVELGFGTRHLLLS